MKPNCCPSSLSDIDAKQILSDNSLNKTKIKIQILQILAKNKKPLSSNEIFNLIGAKNCNISTVFRTLAQFQEKGIIRELNLGEDFFRYELKDQNKKNPHHHHHVRCRDCGDIKFIDQCDLGLFEKMISKLGFKQMEHYLEFTGICSKCS